LHLIEGDANAGTRSVAVPEDHQADGRSSRRT
jgi:hypothetical protein